MKMTRRILLATAMLMLATAGVTAIEKQADVASLDAAIASGKPVLLHVTATWCEVCQAQKPIVSSLLTQSDFSGVIAFEVDFDSQKDVLRHFKVQNQSTMIVFKGGNEINRQIGQTDSAVIETLLRQAL